MEDNVFFFFYVFMNKIEENAKNVIGGFLVKRKFAYRTGFLFMGTMIGAGFASGREILTFYGGVRTDFPWFALLTAVCYGIFFGTIVLRCRRSGVTGLQSFVGTAVPRGRGGFEAFFMGCYLIIFAGMLAGVDALAKVCCGIGDFPLISLLTLFLVVITVHGGLDGLMRANNFLVPILIVSMLVISLVSMSFPNLQDLTLPNTGSQPGGAVRTLLYIGMNLFLSLGVMTEAAKTMEKKDVVKNAGFVFLATLPLLLAVGTAIFTSSVVSEASEMPLLSIAYKLSDGTGIFFGLVIWGAIFTTLISSAFPLVRYASLYTKDDHNKALAIVAVLGFLLSRLGFSRIVDLLYPVMGIAGWFFLILFFVRTGRKATKREKKTCPTSAV